MESRRNDYKQDMQSPSRIILLLAAFAATAFAQQDEAASAPERENEVGKVLKAVKWVEGPSTGTLGGVAQVNFPGGYIFAGPADTIRIMEAFQNPTSGAELGFISPDNGEWFAVYEYDDSGYVKDDEKDSLDSDAILSSLKEANASGNEERKKRGWPPFHIVGWEQVPHYDSATHNLEWAVRGDSEGKPVVNYNTRLLGRGGVMTVTLVCAPEALAAALPQFKESLKGFSYTPGNKYAEFRQGDKMAKYGLSALIAGGVAVAAVKSGALKYLWKLILIPIVAVSALFKKLFAGKKR